MPGVRGAASGNGCSDGKRIPGQKDEACAVAKRITSLGTASKWKSTWVMEIGNGFGNSNPSHKCLESPKPNFDRLAFVVQLPDCPLYSPKLRLAERWSYSSWRPQPETCLRHVPGRAVKPLIHASLGAQCCGLTGWFAQGCADLHSVKAGSAAMSGATCQRRAGPALRSYPSCQTSRK